MLDSSVTEGVRAAQARIAEAVKGGRALNIVGGGSKPFIGRKSDTHDAQYTLNTAELNGVISYEPSELVLRVGAGTPIRDVSQLLAENGQHLPFEPHDFEAHASNSGSSAGSSTVGGLIASGLSGSARPWAGAARDYLLGLGLINGRAEALNFGGQVMKNVAGYDVSRMMVGSLGCFGLITEASFKVLPLPEKTSFFIKQCSLVEALELATAMSKTMSPLTGFAYLEGQAYLRLQGSLKWLQLESEKWGLIESADSQSFWTDLSQHSGTFFQSAHSQLWRISVPKYTNLEQLLAGYSYLLDWAGAQYWLHADAEFVSSIVPQVEIQGGFITSFNQDEHYVLPELGGVSLQLHQRMKAAYDDAAMFNPKRLCLEF